MWIQLVIKCSQDLRGSQFYPYDSIRDQPKLEETSGGL